VTVDANAIRVARTVARELAAQGAGAVTLHGSFARGDAHRESDIDIVAIGKGPEYTLSRRRGYLVSISWTAFGRQWAGLRDPALAGASVPGWREAVVLQDPDRIAGRLKNRAERFTWEAISAASDRWVAEEIVGLAEEVHKTVIGRERGARQTAAVWRSVLALRIAKAMSVRRRILYGTENVLWDLVSDEMGEPWESAQAGALGLRGESLEASCRAALGLYAIAAAEVWPLLDRRQRAVVAHACALAGHPVWTRR
jgi:hypothetical protein